MSLLHSLARINAFELDDFLPFFLAGMHTGWVHQDFAPRLRAFPEVFTVSSEKVALNDELNSFSARTEAVDAAMALLYREQHLAYAYYHPEHCAVSHSTPDQPLMSMRRHVLNYFGLPVYACNVNGIVRTNGRSFFWFSRRAASLSLAPGKLDLLAAGGIACGMGIRDTLIKEGLEEANLPANRTCQAEATGLVSFCSQQGHVLRYCHMYTHLLELPEHFTPRANDQSVEEFLLLPTEEVLAMLSDPHCFAPNVYPTICAHFIREGYIDRTHPEYALIQRSLQIHAPSGSPLLTKYASGD